jgi:hypothetical protein
MTASVTVGRALRYADGSARGLLHHHMGHSQQYREVHNIRRIPAC